MLTNANSEISRRGSNISVAKSDLQIRLEQQGCRFSGQEALANHEPDRNRPCSCGRPVLSDVVSVLRQKGIDCSDLIGGDTVHIFNSRTTEQNLRDLLGSKVRKFKPGVYGTFNPHYNKSIFCEIEVFDESNNEAGRLTP